MRSRHGSEMAPGFPGLVTGAGQLPDATALDGVLVVWEQATGAADCRKTPADRQRLPRQARSSSARSPSRPGG
ncbi:hypothetical protein GCM10023086_75620 [Streptomyces venetus]|uniref:Uncharacterized protein n=1 Tax=Streptomyces venetus TaxID=1701086 RepID=A0ABP8HJE7_9ACTN